jgi:UDP-glucose 4-epimerase
LSNKPSILLTGGAGYIGSHTAVALIEAGFIPVILDDFSNSKTAVLERLQLITGQVVQCHKGSVADAGLIQCLIRRHQIIAIIHFAGFKAVGESVYQPLKYFENNLGGMVALLRAMEGTTCRKMIFSSSATVYGDPISLPITEDFPRSHTNPYGHTKLVCWRTGILRYFNPVGAHSSGLIGEDPSGLPNNLMPYVAQVAVGKRAFLTVYGNDYATPDGTGVRDYIHVQDLAEAHVAAVHTLIQGADSFTVNVGTGQGHSVLEVVRAFEQASKQPVPYQFAPRRVGDVATCYADSTLAQQLLGWRAKSTLADMCADAWHWQINNPDGYA